MDGALWVVRFFLFFFFPFSNSGGGVLQNLMLEGGPEAPFTSPISYLRQSHGTEPGTDPGTERWGRPVGGNQVLTTFARQATPTFNLTCLESGRAESSPARSLALSKRPRADGSYVISGLNAGRPMGVFWLARMWDSSSSNDAYA